MNTEELAKTLELWAKEKEVGRNFILMLSQKSVDSENALGFSRIGGDAYELAVLVYSTMLRDSAITAVLTTAVKMYNKAKRKK
jgi:hypothetical protein